MNKLTTEHTPDNIIASWLDNHQEELVHTADYIFHHPELAYQETLSSKCLADYLESQGFKITWKTAGIDTAFTAVWGGGKPILGFLAEYDALAGVGHACGHNLLGTAVAAAACALKADMETTGAAGTICVYGCPAEEIMSGKIVMNDQGVFDDLDVAITWHPFDRNRVSNDIWQAQDIKNYTFHGLSSHAAKAPEKGRSALDAAELTNIGVNYLREHVDRDCYMHYCYLNGGERPNIVPDYAKLWYMVRAYTYAQMKEVEQRVKRIAEGACLMTDTTVEFETLGDTHDNRLNFTLSRIVWEAMEAVGAPCFTEEETAYARQIAQHAGVPGFTGDFDTRIVSADRTIKIDNGSTDLADVSQVVPTINMFAACFAANTPMHTWAVTAQACRPSAHRGMRFAAASLALAGARLASDPESLAAVRAEFEKER